MDAVDKVFYKDAEASEELVGAYEIFNGPDGELVLEDMMRFCSWGAQDSTIMDEQDAKSVLAMQRYIWRVKAMLNSKPTKGETEDE